MVKKEISKMFSFKGWSLYEWARLNAVEIIKVATAIGSAILIYVQDYPSWASGLAGLIVKFGLDALHYFLIEKKL